MFPHSPSQGVCFWLLFSPQSNLTASTHPDHHLPLRSTRGSAPSPGTRARLVPPFYLCLPQVILPNHTPDHIPSLCLPRLPLPSGSRTNSLQGPQQWSAFQPGVVPKETCTFSNGSLPPPLPHPSSMSLILQGSRIPASALRTLHTACPSCTLWYAVSAQ